MCTMNSWSRTWFLMLKIIYFTLHISEAQRLQVQPEVTGYLGLDVTLLCQFIQGPKKADISQVQWNLLPPEGKKITIAVFKSQTEVLLFESPLKERVEISEQSLIIRNVEMSDAGLYTCTVTTFPIGLFEKSTNLIVQEHDTTMLMVPRMIAAGVFVLIVVTMMATTHIIIIRIRHEASVKYHGGTTGE